MTWIRTHVLRYATPRMRQFLLLFFCGLLIGIFAKSQALHTITIGHDDYRIRDQKESLRIDFLEESLLRAPLEEQLLPAQESPSPSE